MSSFYQLLDKQVDETEIDITDFSKYHRHTFNDQQDSLSIRTVKELNNLRYTEFENKYLIPFSKNGKIKNGDATLMWIVYEDMKEVLNTYDNNHLC